MILVPARYRILRRAALVYAAVACVAFLVSSPLGGNVSRLRQYAAGPILLGMFGWRRRWVPLLAAPLLFWQVVPRGRCIGVRPPRPLDAGWLLPAA